MSRIYATRFFDLEVSGGKQIEQQRLFDTTLLEGSAFEPLKDEKVLVNFVIFHGVMTWMNGEIDIAPETMYVESYPYTAQNVGVE
jgi:hypothetical protein